MLFHENKTYTDMVHSFMEDQLKDNKEFQDALNPESKPVRDILSTEASTNKETFQKIKKGLVKIEKASVWWAQDVHTLSTLLREVEKNYKLPKNIDEVNWNDPKATEAIQKAIKETSRYTQTYSIPTYIMPNVVGRFMSWALSNRQITVFAAYDYGKLKILGNAAKDIFNKDIRTNPEARQKAIDQIQRMAVRGFILYGLYKLEQELNKGGESYTKLRRSGTNQTLWDSYKFAKGDESFKDFMGNLVHVSPVTNDALNVWNDRDSYSGGQIYNPNGAFLETSRDIMHYVFSGGNIFNALSHANTGAEDNFKQDITQMILPANFAHYAPYEQKVVENLKTYKEHYEPLINKYQRDLSDAKTPEGKKIAIQQWIDVMHTARESLINTDLKFTKEKIDALKNDVRTPTDSKYKDALGFWEHHLIALEAQKKKDISKTSPYVQKEWLRDLEGMIYKAYHPR
jgi:hypothetical protein